MARPKPLSATVSSLRLVEVSVLANEEPAVAIDFGDHPGLWWPSQGPGAWPFDCLVKASNKEGTPDHGCARGGRGRTGSMWSVVPLAGSLSIPRRASRSRQMPQQMDVKAGILAGSDGRSNSSSEGVQQFPAFAFNGIFGRLEIGAVPFRQPSIQLVEVVFLKCLQDAGSNDRGSMHQ